MLLLDLRLPTMDGFEVLRRVKVLDAQVPVIVMTAVNEARCAADAFKLGAVDYLVKPCDIDVLLTRLHGTAAARHVMPQTAVTPEATMIPSVLEGLVGQSAPMRQLAMLISRVAATDATVFLTGESGVGKERVAHALHQQSLRRTGPFLAVHCGALPASLVESTFFGHERGAFTGAVQRQQGVFERARWGTLLLDEIGNLQPESQAALLRVLQERTVTRVGGHQNLHVDVRVVASSNQDVGRLVAAGRFRADLFYRLNVVPLHVPPLRERQEDIPVLVRYFLAQYNQRFGRQLPGLTWDAVAALGRYRWPGNVRELEHLIARLVATSRPYVVDVADLPPEVHAGEPGA